MGNYVFDQNLAMAITQKILLAVLILLVTWILAKAAKWTFAKLVNRLALFRRTTASGESLGASLGKIVSLLIWLFGLLAVLQVFNLAGVMAPLQTLLNNIMDFVPRLIGAGLIFFIGAMVARIVRDIAVTSLQTISFDKWVNRGGAEALTGNPQISKTIGVIVYVLIIIPVAILALDALGLQSISAPASDMLRLILDAIPRIIGAALLLGIGYLVSRFVVQILKEILPGLGADRAVGATEILPEGVTVTTVVARIAQIAIILFFAIAATRMLGFPELTAILDRILELGGRVLFGAAVIIVGFLIARLLERLIGGAGETTLPASIVKWAAIVLFTFMGLEFMGVGEDIVQIAFGALVIGGAIAGALAFGLGGRNWAARQLAKLDDAGTTDRTGGDSSVG
ncbi:MAG TPA: mechanosensitive ion channel [Steroidobacter sp.]|nr:mechanosensitive ion channel [Steroidobacter sp.]